VVFSSKTGLPGRENRYVFKQNGLPFLTGFLISTTKETKEHEGKK